MLKTFTNTNRDWLAHNALERAHAGTANSAAVARTRLEQLRPLPENGDLFHPFRLYQIQRAYLTEPDPETDWRTFHIRSGYVMGAEASGTDHLEPDTDDPTETANYYIIPLPAGEDTSTEFWFWLEITQSEAGAYTAELRYSDDPTADNYDDGGPLNPIWSTDNPWETFPTPDGEHVPIAKVTLTLAAGATPRSVTVRQYLRSDIVFAGGGGGGGVCPMA